MGRTCFCPGCKSGYRSDVKIRKQEGKIMPSFFSAPKDAELLEKWRKAIPRSDRLLSEKDSVCSLHFEDEDFNNYFEEKMPDGTVWKLAKGKARLKIGVIPSIFPNVPTYLSMFSKKRKLPAIRNVSKKICTSTQDSPVRDSPTEFNYAFENIAVDALLSLDSSIKKKRLKRDAVPTLNLPKWPSESQNVNLASEKKKQRNGTYSKVLQSNETEINPVTYEEEEISPIADERLYGEFIEVKSEPVPTSGNISDDFNEVAQVPHLEKDVNVLPGIDEEISCDMFSDDEELKLIGNESTKILRQKLEKLSAHYKKLKMCFKESQVLCKLYAKEIVSLKEIIDSLRQIIKVSNDT